MPHVVAGDVSVLAFCKWRSLVEIVHQDVKDALEASQARPRSYDACISRSYIVISY